MASSSQTSSVALRYAGSLLDLAVEAKKVDAVAADLDNLEKMMADISDLKRLIESPVFSSDDQLAAISALVEKSGFAPLTQNFLKVVAGNRRLFAIPSMIDAFRKAVADMKGLVSAEVTSATKLTAAQEKELKATLKGVAGKDVDVTVTVDPTILGGLIVKMGSRMIDTSLKTKLSSLKLSLKEVG